MWEPPAFPRLPSLMARSALDPQFPELAPAPTAPTAPTCLCADWSFANTPSPFGLFAEHLLSLRCGAQVPPTKVPLALPPQPCPPNPGPPSFFPPQGCGKAQGTLTYECGWWPQAGWVPEAQGLCFRIWATAQHTGAGLTLNQYTF